MPGALRTSPRLRAPLCHAGRPTRMRAHRAAVGAAALNPHSFVENGPSSANFSTSPLSVVNSTRDTEKPWLGRV